MWCCSFLSGFKINLCISTVWIAIYRPFPIYLQNVLLRSAVNWNDFFNLNQIDYICHNAFVVLVTIPYFSYMVQEEIRFMINPELIVGMLFMASMEDNEAIEIFGAERFSQYMGLVETLSTLCRTVHGWFSLWHTMNPVHVSCCRYGSSFRFVGDYLDTKPLDSMGRRRTRIVAIDALDCPARLHYESSGLLR